MFLFPRVIAINAVAQLLERCANNAEVKGLNSQETDKLT